MKDYAEWRLLICTFVCCHAVLLIAVTAIVIVRETFSRKIASIVNCIP